MDVNFADIDAKRESKFRKVEYLKLDPGQYTIRILEFPATKKYNHFLNFSSVECLGDDCLICENNRRILYEHPKDYKDVKGWCPRRERFWVNVLNKTNDENKVCVLSSGPTLFEDFNMMAQATRTESDEVVDIRAYDWILMVKGTGREREITPVPQYRGKNEPISTEGLELFDLTRCLPNITRDEMADFLKGVSLKDIFNLRRATNEVLSKEETMSEENLEKDIEDSISEIFKT